MKRLLTALAAAAVLATGCSASADDTSQRPGLAEKVCKEEVASRLKDPDSAQFRNITSEVVNEDEFWKLFGEVSGENSFGGRNGFIRWGCTAEYDYGDESVRVNTVQVAEE